MDYVLNLLCMYGVMFTLRNAQLPLLVRCRDWVTTHSAFFRKMLECSFCTGFHAGWITYLITSYASLFELSLFYNLSSMVFYSFVSATFCYFFDNLMLKLEA